ncbi:hypothetical protein CVD28_03550 [Bacillus sp. M6-12]|uniref:hypothetical protein n=1 Tax=Bacillus sp. M6-12 TaxID=2054166 RepID=UPI000C767793|nr:hypothetical protein [Bacillus sp. M6-12]PLS19504.1 hypothetical protein CVD28_03550 [Bacillus sp. M6-12]
MKKPIVLNKKPFHIKFPCGHGVYYEVKEEKKRFYAIYLYDNGLRTFKTHRENQKNACNVAKLLQEAYLEGIESVRDEESMWYLSR